MLRHLATAATDVLSIIWPAVCVACNSDAAQCVCDACQEDIDRLAAIKACPACGRSSAGSACPNCGGQGTAHLTRVHRLGTFDPPLSHLIRAAKFGGRWELCGWLGNRLGESMTGVATDTVVVPVPLHPHRKARRGYDQADLIASKLARRLGLPMTRVLSRQRNTRPQTDLQGTAARAVNLRDAFIVDRPDLVAGKRVLLVDDVTTSGNTLRSAARTLAAAGPTGLSAAVVAVADKVQDRPGL